MPCMVEGSGSARVVNNEPCNSNFYPAPIVEQHEPKCVKNLNESYSSNRKTVPTKTVRFFGDSVKGLANVVCVNKYSTAARFVICFERRPRTVDRCRAAPLESLFIVTPAAARMCPSFPKKGATSKGSSSQSFPPVKMRGEFEQKLPSPIELTASRRIDSLPVLTGRVAKGGATLKSLREKH